ncbi:MAG: hypothetical protein LBU64_03575 [Planctomycetota bacterium]|nr:hypothetical protein [Planctomycetota bacterium]
MDSAIGWFCLVIVALCLAGFWFGYLVKLVLNDEVVRERRRRLARARELERRRAEDKELKKRRKGR